MKRLLLILPLAGCPHHGGATGPAASELYAGIFEPQRSWAYTVTDADGATSEVSCQVTDERDWPDGKVSMITCDGTFGDGSEEAVSGMWAADAHGLWYLPELAVDDLADTTGMPRAQMTPERMMLAAHPAAPCFERAPMKVCFADGGVTSGALGGITFAEAADEE